MSETLMPAAPGWRVCVWSRESDSPADLEIVAWERRRDGDFGRETLHPWVRSECGMEVSPIRDDEWFAGILAPGDTLYDWQDAAREVADAERQAEERRERAAS